MTLAFLSFSSSSYDKPEVYDQCELGTTVQRTVNCLGEAEWEGLFPNY